VGVITVITTVLPYSEKPNIGAASSFGDLQSRGSPKKNTTDSWLSHVEPPIFEEKNSHWGSSSKLKIENQKYS